MAQHVTIENVSPNLAFFVRLRAMKGANGSEIAPAIWEDNYFELPAGELREVTATFARKLTGGQRVRILADGWNVTPAETR